jgi:pimeloyl-ACP methyl ester carboxylesterase
MQGTRLIHVGGRVLRARSVGTGTPVVYAHGALGSILEQPVPEAVLSRWGLQLLLVERPGFGASTRHDGRSLATWVDDLRAVLDELSLPRVRVLGWSIGAVYALAAAALAPDRVMSLSLASPILGGGFGGETREVDLSSPSAVSACREELGRTVAAPFQVVSRGPDALLDAILQAMPQVDREVVPETRAMLAASCAEALRQGAEPAIDEGLVIRAKWPFAIEHIECDVEVWSGDADVRANASVRLLSHRLPQARQVVIAGGGHYLVFSHGEAILSSLASARIRAACAAPDAGT